MKYSLITFGCRVNQADSLALEGRLLARGDQPAAPSDADLLIVNSCSVTASADQGVRQTIRRVVRDNPGVQVIVTGCYATRRPDEIRALPNVVDVVSNDRKDEMFGDGPCGRPEPGTGGRTALTIRVQTGCEERCSYCIIPATRGASRSRPLEQVLREIRFAVEAGYKEIAITGVHLGSYGRDLSPRRSLLSLVTALASWPDEVLFRISSLEPMDCPPALVDLVAGSPRLAPHFHLPLQHGSDEMLRRMRRPYSARDYRRLVEQIARTIPHASIGTDLIVGFPGETDVHFGETRAIVTDLPLSHLHVFPYSDRPGTDAAAMRDKVEGTAIRERGAALRALGAAKAHAFRTRQAGTSRRALVVDDGWSAVTDNYLKARLPERRERNTWTVVSL